MEEQRVTGIASGPGSREPDPSVPAHPNAEGRIFDFRRSGWGHAIHMPAIKMGARPLAWWEKLLGRKPETYSYLTCLGHSTPTPNEGDVMLVPMQSGKTGRFQVIEIRWLGNPRDMFDIERADFVGYEPASATAKTGSTEGESAGLKGDAQP
jgi:hypothetical protein